MGGPPQSPVAGSYAFNSWLLAGSGIETNGGFGKSIPVHPSQTPAFADGYAPMVGPHTNDAPMPNLYENPDYIGIAIVQIARHRSRPASAAPRNWDTSKPLPGMVDLALYDSHAEQVRLENLWNYYWNATWVVPSPRPGE
jgi:hypothetical protein